VYEVCDAGPLCDTATVNLTITAVNDPPVGNDDTGSVAEGGTLNVAAPGVLSNDTDPENDPLTVITTPVTSPANGTLMLNADGSYSYTHDGSQTTSDSFVYQVCDTEPLCDTATVTIDVSASGTFTTLYVSSTSGGTVGGISFKDEDILAYDLGTGVWSMYFDGSDVGIGGTDVNAFHIDADGSILLSLTAAATIPDVGSIDDSDIVRFIPTSTGTNTAGTFEWYFDGSDVDLSANGEDVVAIGFLPDPDGRLAISTTGSFSVSGVSGKDEDLLIFAATSLGETTSGSWEFHFDGSDVGLDTSNEDIRAGWIDANNDIYLTTKGAFSVAGAAGDGSDIFTCVPGSTGIDTSCTFSLFWDGTANGFGSENIDGLFLQR
jgi:VCBS repeat-containing protein